MAYGSYWRAIYLEASVALRLSLFHPTRLTSCEIALPTLASRSIFAVRVLASCTSTSSAPYCSIVFCWEYLVHQSNAKYNQYLLRPLKSRCHLCSILAKIHLPIAPTIKPRRLVPSVSLMPNITSVYFVHGNITKVISKCAH